MPEPIGPDLVYQLVSVSAPSLSPDGTRLAFARSQVDRETMEAPSRIMVMELPDGEPVPFTAGPHDTVPKFSPDGKAMAFLRLDEGKTNQLWTIPTTGGEARRLTTLPGGVTGCAWSPNSRSLAVVSDVDPDRLPDDHDPKTDPRVRVVRRIKYRGDTVGWRGDAFRHLFVVDAETGDARQITDGDGDDSAPVWSPDGARIAFMSDRGPDRDVVSRTGAYVVPASDGEPELWSEGLASVGPLAWSPDGRRIAVVGSNDAELSAGLGQGWVFILERGESPRRLTDDSIAPQAGYPPVTPPAEIMWTPDGHIVFLADARGESYLCALPVRGGEVRRIAGGGLQLGAATFDSTARRAAVVATTPASPGDIALIETATETQRQLTSYNRAYLDRHPPGRLEKSTRSRDGVEIESRVWLPPDFDPSETYPMVLDIHGGPHGVFADAFSPTQQVLATAGYVVLAVNPRGSSTYGLDFVKAVLGDWGGEDYLDIMAAVDNVTSRPYIDPDRLGVTGYSYGGYMSSWIVGHDHRFKAAVVGAPCIDLYSMYGTSDIGVWFGELNWHARPWESPDKALERSPITYAPNVETPVLLMHGEDDYRCPIGQSEEYFVALKRLGKEVEFVRFPASSHGFMRGGHPRLREEYLSRTLAWFDGHLGRES